ncbi:hypothetical protein U9M48_004354 [Paspalum notatum var. saurae]|uniref:Uncharacterized protein n=1 Tax=Paspalum notatum var. saurae TaxID=547442 RepID=A0AAQ3SER8_PASNO
MPQRCVPYPISIQSHLLRFVQTHPFCVLARGDATTGVSTTGPVSALHKLLPMLPTRLRTRIGGNEIMKTRETTPEPESDQLYFRFWKTRRMTTLPMTDGTTRVAMLRSSMPVEMDVKTCFPQFML